MKAHTHGSQQAIAFYRAYEVRGLSGRKKGIAVLALAALFSSTGALASTEALQAPKCPDTAYVTNSFSQTVSAIDTATNRVVATIPVGNGPVNPTFTPDGKKVYVANAQDSSLSVIDTTTNEVTATIPMGGPEPSGLAFTPDGRQLAITLFGSKVDSTGQVVIMTVATGELGAPIPVESRPERIAMAPDGQHAYAVNLLSGSMSVIDLAQGAVSATIPVGFGPFNALVSADGSKIYIDHALSNTVAVITDPLSDKVSVSDVATKAGPDGMAFSGNQKSLFVTDVFGSSIQEIDLATNTVSRTANIGAFPGFIDVTQDGKHAYVVHPFGSTVSVIDTSTLEIIDKIEVGLGPSVVAICHSK